MEDISVFELTLDHWLDNLCLAEEGREIDKTAESCALCRKYWDEEAREDDLGYHCRKCPLFKKGNCCTFEGSPYDEACKASAVWKTFHDDESHEQLIDAILDMVEVLENLKEEYDA